MIKDGPQARRQLLPVVQGGMGVGVSAGGLAGAVAATCALGTISAVHLRRLHTDLMVQTGHLDKEPDARQTIEAANLVALDREIRRARSIAKGQGAIAVNIMKAVSQYSAYVQQALPHRCLPASAVKNARNVGPTPSSSATAASTAAPAAGWAAAVKPSA